MDTTVETKSEPFTIKLKNGCGEVSVQWDDIQVARVARLVVEEGLTSLINKVGMSKLLPGISKLEGEAKNQAIDRVRERAEQTVRELYAGTLEVRGKTKKAANNAVEVEALRLAKLMAKQIIKDSGQRVGAYTAKELTVFAKAVLERNPSLRAQAEKNLSERAVVAEGIKAPSLESIFGDKANDPANKAKPKAPPKKAKGEPISAKQASMAAPRQKPGSHVTH